jgi:four helix bundle protein
LGGGKEMRFENLEVWKRSARLSANIYKELKDLSDYSFKRQMTSAGLSISSNIAEGIRTGIEERNY